MGDIQPADQRSRRIALAIIAIGALIGAALILAARHARPQFEGWLLANPTARAGLVVVVLMIATTAPLLGLAVYLWRLGSQIVRTRRFPPPGMRVVRNTPIVTERAACHRGRLIQSFSVLLAMAAVLLAFFLWRLMTLLTSQA